jgi:carbon storage regulator
MLVLTRRPGESIVIGNGIKLTVVSVGPGRVKIGIEAPPNVRIDREEIHARIQHEQSSDVIAAVSAMAAGNGEQNTMITTGSNTEVLTNRIADQLPEVAVPAHPAPAPPPPSADRLNKYRLPRKPR